MNIQSDRCNMNVALYSQDDTCKMIAYENQQIRLSRIRAEKSKEAYIV